MVRIRQATAVPALDQARRYRATPVVDIQVVPRCGMILIRLGTCQMEILVIFYGLCMARRSLSGLFHVQT